MIHVITWFDDPTTPVDGSKCLKGEEHPKVFVSYMQAVNTEFHIDIKVMQTILNNLPITSTGLICKTKKKGSQLWVLFSNHVFSGGANTFAKSH
jgi:hypothetical protein